MLARMDTSICVYVYVCVCVCVCVRESEDPCYLRKKKCYLSHQHLFMDADKTAQAIRSRLYLLLGIGAMNV